MARSRAPSLANEPFAFAELASLFWDPVYLGARRAQGDGRLVVVLPGLFANDWYLQPMHSWLRRAGFQPVNSTLPINAGCPERLSRRVEQELERQRRRRPGPVALIGHSGGGVLARAIAARLGDGASHLIALGSPIGAIARSDHWRSRMTAGAPAAESVRDAGIRARRVLDPSCNVPLCGCPFPDDVRQRLHPDTKVVSIYSRNDPIVPSWTSVVPGAENVEVSGTHSGLAYNRAVYRTLADVLRS